MTPHETTAQDNPATMTMTLIVTSCIGFLVLPTPQRRSITCGGAGSYVIGVNCHLDSSSNFRCQLHWPYCAFESSRARPQLSVATSLDRLADDTSRDLCNTAPRTRQRPSVMA